MTSTLFDCDFGELVCENGQILTRVLSSAESHESHRYMTSFTLHDSEPQVLKVGRETSMEKRSGKLWDKEFLAHTIMDPHPKHTQQDSLNKKGCYTHEVFAKLSDSILNNEFAYTSNSHDEQLVPSADLRNFKHGNACYLSRKEPQIISTRPKGDQISDSSLQQWQAPCRGGSSKIPVSKMQDKQPEQEQNGEPENRIGQMNFSYFLKLAALDKDKAQTVDDARAPTSPGLSRLEKSKSDCPNGANPFELRPIPPPAASKPVCQEVAFGKTTASANQVHTPNLSFSASKVKGKKGKARAEKSAELLVPSSSTCSREASNYPSYSLESKCLESEESEHQSQSSEEEPKRAAGAMSTPGGSAGSKRHRSAEVHSLSEKRRRDRINKKMCLLQELIPNCKKGDKISILDEAIDYLKTLQLQVQVMSMGTGMCMPPMMIPAALQHIQAAQLPHFSPMGMGMGMRMGVGMGMGMGMGMGLGLGMGLGCSPEHFPCPPVLGAGALSGIAGTAAHQMLGHPGQLLPPFIPLHAGSLRQSVMVPSVPKNIHSVEDSSCSSPSSSN